MYIFVLLINFCRSRKRVKKVKERPNQKLNEKLFNVLFGFFLKF